MGTVGASVILIFVVLSLSFPFSLSSWNFSNLGPSSKEESIKTNCVFMFHISNGDGQGLRKLGNL